MSEDNGAEYQTPEESEAAYNESFEEAWQSPEEIDEEIKKEEASGKYKEGTLEGHDHPHLKPEGGDEPTGEGDGIDLVPTASDIAGLPPGWMTPMVVKDELIWGLEHRNEIGQAERFVRAYGHIYRNVIGIGHVCYNGMIWDKRQIGMEQHMASGLAVSQLEEAKRIPDMKLQEEEVAWAYKSFKNYAIKNMFERLESHWKTKAEVKDFDKDPKLVVCLSGTIDLKTGNQRKWNSKDFITVNAPVRYNPKATDWQWEKFLDDLTSNNAELKEFLLRLLGYGLTGYTLEEIIIMAFGPTASGKSTLISAIKGAVGSLAATANYSTFIKQKFSSSTSEDLARLVDKRYVFCNETDEGPMNEARAQMVTGGDTVLARLLYGHYFEYEPEFLLFLSSNKLPDLDPDNNAMQRRIIVLPLTHGVPVKDIDPNLKLYLTHNPGAQEAIFASLVAGAQRWWEAYEASRKIKGVKTTGLVPPECVTKAKAEYRENVNIMVPIVEECFKTGSDEKGIPYYCIAGELQKVIDRYCEVNKMRPIAPQTYTPLLKLLGFTNEVDGQRARDATGARIWLGLKPKCEEEELDF